MITDLKILIKRCKEELHDQKYRAQYTAKLTEEWENLLKWMKEKQLTEFD